MDGVHRREAGGSPQKPTRRWRSTLAVLTVCLAAAIGAGVAWAKVTPAGTPAGNFGTHGVSVVPGVGLQATGLLRSGAGVITVGEGDDQGSTSLVSLIRLRANGSRDRSFGTILRPHELALPARGAVQEPSGRIVIAVSVYVGGKQPCYTELWGFTSAGHVDASFGSHGITRLSTPGCAVRLLQGSDGVLRAASEATGNNGDVIGMQLARVSASGTQLGATVVPIQGDDYDNDTPSAPAAAVIAPDDEVTLVGTEGYQPFLARFAADGSLERNFGTQGIKLVDLHNVELQDAAIDARGRILLAGGHVGQSPGGLTAVSGMVARTSAQGVIDKGFANGGRTGFPHENELEVVRPGGSGHVLLAADDGTVLRMTSAGKLDRGFGHGGSSVLPPAGPHDANPLYRVSDLLATSDAAYVAAAKYGVYRLAVEKVWLHAVGFSPPVRGGTYNNCFTRAKVRYCPVQISVDSRARTLRFFTFPDCAFSPVTVRGIVIRSGGRFGSRRGGLTLSGRFLTGRRIQGTFRYTGRARAGCKAPTQKFLIHFSPRRR